MERSDRMAVMGFVEVIRQVPRHYALLSSLKRRLRSGSVALLVVIDYPGFNMKLAAAAAAAGVPVLYYITPQVWAWGAGRLSELARIVTRAAPILPFEEPLLRSHGINATFVGHPLLDRIGEMFFSDVMIAALHAKPVRLDHYISIAESFRRLEFVTRELDCETVRIFQIDRVHESAITLIK